MLDSGDTLFLSEHLGVTPQVNNYGNERNRTLVIPHMGGYGPMTCVNHRTSLVAAVPSR